MLSSLNQFELHSFVSCSKAGEEEGGEISMAVKYWFNWDVGGSYCRKSNRFIH